VVALEQAQRFGVEAEGGALVVERLHALEELVVERDGVLVRRQFRRVLGLDLFHRVVGVGAGEVEEHVAHADQRLAALVERHDGVLERRLLGAVGDGVDLRELFFHALVETRGEMLVADLVERRQLVGQGARGEERIGSHRGGSGLVGRRGRGFGGRERAGQAKGGREGQRKSGFHRGILGQRAGTAEAYPMPPLRTPDKRHAFPGLNPLR
jgi:hypothetical protein